MKRSTWRILAFGALMGSVALPASAQVVIGGTGTPNVVVNWSVLDGLGRQPNLADMLKSDSPNPELRVAPRQSAQQGVQYRPYKAGATPYAKPAKTTGKPAKAAAKKSSVVPAAAKSTHMADLVQSGRTTAAQPPLPPKPAVTQVAEVAKPAAPAIIGPQIALPEVPKPAPAPSPVQMAKADPDPAPVSAPKADPAPKAEPAPLPPTALTPPPAAVVPAPVVKAEPKPEPTPQVAALPPSPPPATASSFKGDTLSVSFAVDSARLPDSAHGDLDRLAKRMQRDESLALQLLAYADGDDANASKARRLSLSRALEVRKYLMDQGLRSTRIEVRALGNKLEGGGSPDRVDAVLVAR